METKKINSRVAAQIKNIFKANENDYNRLKKINNKIADLEAERKEIEENIALTEQRVKNITGGYTSDQIIQVVVIPKFEEDGVTPKFDKNGYPMKDKKYTYRYPETIVPLEEATAEEVSASVDEVKNDTEGADNDIYAPLDVALAFEPDTLQTHPSK